ncbi:MAG TPA: CHAT domain-containing protein, partial [Longimicrobiales bacterium]|nr:CHAT domain-containing protein [Longimicrobiales bacterium]
EGTRLIDQALNAIGSMVRDKTPDQLEPILSELWKLVHAATGRPPTVLLHSAEPHVPWELASLENPPDPDAPPFLGAQFAVGRWILGPRGVSVPPAHEVVVQTMAVVAGDYRSSLNLRPLPHAEAEGRALEQRWGAVRLAASVDALDRLLEATLETNGAGGSGGGAEAIHFACHGEVDPARPADAMIYLDNDWPLDPSLFLDAPVGRSHGPFLFLNACQVGQTGELLGEYAGFAGSSLRAGFRGVVAPLWSVSDEIAEQIALEFYERAWASGTAGEPVSMILRDMRRRYPAHEAVPPSTWLAYVFYGNPALVLRRAGE